MNNKNALAIAYVWNRNSDKILKVASSMMFIIAVIWLSYQFWRLLWDTSDMAAVDLNLRYIEVQHLFARKPVYDDLNHAVYPPATYVILWPFLGWLTFPAARWLWAITTIVVLGVLTILLVQESQARTPTEKLFISFLPLAIYGTGATIGNGQLGIHIVLCLVSILRILRVNKRTWIQDILIASLMIFALTKPSTSVYFFWLLLFCTKNLRPAVITIVGYVGLILFASFYQDDNIIDLMKKWLTSGISGAKWGATQGEGAIDVQVNLHSLLGSLGWENGNTIASLTMLLVLGIWIYKSRQTNLWLLMGVTSIFGRFSTYHGWYDDVILLLPMIALFKIAKYKKLTHSKQSIIASLLFATMLLFLLAPGGIYLLPYPWKEFYIIGQTITWLIVMIFLMQASSNPVFYRKL